jgi:hypothetical protein
MGRFDYIIKTSINYLTIAFISQLIICVITECLIPLWFIRYYYFNLNIRVYLIKTIIDIHLTSSGMSDKCLKNAQYIFVDNIVKTGDLLKEIQFIWNVLWQDKKKVIFACRWLLNRGDHMDWIITSY